MYINQDKTTKINQQGFTLIEFMISMALSLAAILVVTSIYVTSFQIDSKTIKYARLNDEVTSIMALLSEDIKRAGYDANAEVTISSETPAPAEFRTLLVSEFTGETSNSCILFSYDFNENNEYDSSTEDFGYRLHDGKLETRKDGKSCTETGWESLTDPDFVNISAIEISPAVPAEVGPPAVPAVPAVYGDMFKCKVSDDGDTTDYENPDTVTDPVTSVTTTTNIEINCAAGNLPYAGIYNGTVTVEISFTATLVDDTDISLTASEKVLVRNASYD
ncbi:prepilin-type N-terminal cleavage/methylation domain-containing protein [Candidatus Colwellia aromaticivorans]|uniref:prepilin-type N-terminal cleavage/methylation domain-containing protein n=1 Tax=Candidatus Colwellia aromaticivorans TaxID=2267621 RepID=UPI000DF1741E|nr:prepilin-type N-terminal cleavage/methylation domain-containing protein [Candidatus Colwellia aromaticivorans]